MQLLSPLSGTEDYKWWRFTLVMTIISALYFGTNRWHLFPATLITRTWIDNAIPFVPGTVLIYLSYFFSFFAVFYQEKNQGQLKAYCLALLLLNLICNLIFILYPTTYDRRPSLAVEEMPWALEATFASLYFLDSPANCLPSLHVANSFLAALVWFRRNSRRFLLYLIWTFLISVSTLTTKQHYLYDIVMGYLAAWCSYCVVFSVLKDRLCPSAMK